jgi:Sec-independent protein translocase protein TatA
MFGIGFTEFAIILVIALIAIGPEKLPEIMKVLGKAFGRPWTRRRKTWRRSSPLRRS